MKRVFFDLGVIGYLVCAVWTLLPTPSRLYFTEVYAAMSGCALVALVSVSKPRRRLALAALLFSLAGAFLSWRGNARTGGMTGDLRLTPPSGGRAWIQWSSTRGGNNHWYALTPLATNWVAARNLAISWGGHLATITSASEQDFINTTFLAGAFEHRPVWIGLRRKGGKLTWGMRAAMEDFGILQAKSAFGWVTGEPVSYSNWKPGQPDNFAPGEAYVAINWHHSDSPPRGTKGDWNDAPLNGTTGFGGATDGPYFGLVERGSDETRPPTITPFQLKLATVAWLLLAMGLAFARRRSVLSAEDAFQTPESRLKRG